MFYYQIWKESASTGPQSLVIVILANNSVKYAEVNTFDNAHSFVDHACRHNARIYTGRYRNLEYASRPQCNEPKRYTRCRLYT
jgi:hypothetical protein